MSRSTSGVLPPAIQLSRQGPRTLFGIAAISSQRLRSFDERQVGTRVERAVGARHGLVEIDDRASVGAGDDRELRFAPRRDGGANLRQKRLAIDDPLVVEMAAAFGELLILEMDRSHARSFELANGASDVQLVAVTGVGVGDHGNVHDGGDAPRVLDHLGHGHQAIVRKPGRCGRACTGHVHGGESRLHDQPRGDAVVGPGGDDQLGSTAAAPSANSSPALRAGIVNRSALSMVRDAVARASPSHAQVSASALALAQSMPIGRSREFASSPPPLGKFHPLAFGTPTSRAGRRLSSRRRTRAPR